MFIEWKNGGVTAEVVNTRLVDSGLPSFTNNIENGSFVDPATLEKITSPDKKNGIDINLKYHILTKYVKISGK